jgi:hypothetical protein
MNVEFHSCDGGYFDGVAIHYMECLEDSSDVICLRYMHLTKETLSNNVEAKES